MEICGRDEMSEQGKSGVKKSRRSVSRNGEFREAGSCLSSEHLAQIAA